MSITPSLYFIRLLTGRSSPFWAFRGSRIPVTTSGTFLSGAGSSSAASQLSGTGTSLAEEMPASMAARLRLTTSSPLAK